MEGVAEEISAAVMATSASSIKVCFIVYDDTKFTVTIDYNKFTDLFIIRL
jgi:hypothetical protein